MTIFVPDGIRAAEIWARRIRPWYPGGPTAHLSPDCPELRNVDTQPHEGAGWLDLRASDICQACLNRHGYGPWHADCATCGACLCDEFASQPYISEADARRWKDEHTCQPEVTVKAPPKPSPSAPATGQLALIPLADLTAERTAA